MGFPTTLQVTSVTETTPPILTSFAFSPMSIDVTNGSADVTLTAGMTDDFSGASQAAVYFVGPSNNSTQAGYATTLISGTNLNGTWQGTMTFPRFLEPGTWTVSMVQVE